MKKKITLAFTFLIFSLTAFAQPQWRFHVAFEDATGAKDTIWMVYDTSATASGIDSALGEVHSIINSSIFNVWIYNNNLDSTKTYALPYLYYPGHSVEIRAFNYQYPITISWDTALLYATYLPFQQGTFNIGRMDNDYFFGINNCPPCHYFDMLIANQATAPSFTWGSGTHFPLSIFLLYDPTSVEELNISKNEISFYPNPVKNELSISSNQLMKKLIISNILGKEIINTDIEKNKIAVDLFNIPEGIYIIKIINNLNQIHYEQIIKLN